MTGKRKKKPVAPQQPLRWRLWLGLGLGVAAIAALAWAGGPAAVGARVASAIDGQWRATGFVVKRVTVVGAVHLDPAYVQRSAGLDPSGSIFAQDLGAIRSRLLALSWVREAVVIRQLPDSLRIELIERRPVALWQKDRRFHLIDREGAVIAPVWPGDYPELALVVGKGANRATAGLLDLLAGNRDLARRVVAATRVGERRWDIEFDSKTVVALPEENTEAAWRRLGDLEARHKLLGQGYARLDLRLPDMLVARPESAIPVVRAAGGADRPA